MRNFLEIDDLSPGELSEVLDLARRSDVPAVMAGRGMALLFEKPSTRTRNATEMAVAQLGGHPVSLAMAEVGLDTRESAEDLARTLACYHCVIGARVFHHSTLERMAAALSLAGVEVAMVNLLSDRGHPSQALADLLTLGDVFGPLAGRTVAWVGDANNVCRSLVLAGAMARMSMRVASPLGVGLAAEDLDRVHGLGGHVEVTHEPRQAVAGVDAICTDVWVSMGQEAEADQRRADFQGFTVDEELVSLASPEAVVLHCLPAHRGEEITAGVINGPQSVVWRQAANRLAAMRGLLWWLAAPS
ncbi:MAG: ornithine carbamoyltransferase [Acidimicrobiales bacterium]|nr:MAG: ornithine carbamoyltransferase [Acidimicrobiales bacterium]